MTSHLHRVQAVGRVLGGLHYHGADGAEAEQASSETVQHVCAFHVNLMFHVSWPRTQARTDIKNDPVSDFIHIL